MENLQETLTGFAKMYSAMQIPASFLSIKIAYFLICFFFSANFHRNCVKSLIYMEMAKYFCHFFIRSLMLRQKTCLNRRFLSNDALFSPQYVYEDHTISMMVLINLFNHFGRSNMHYSCYLGACDGISHGIQNGMGAGIEILIQYH